MNYVTHDKLPGWMQLEMILNNGWKLERASQLELLTSVKFTYTKPAELLCKSIVFKLQFFPQICITKDDLKSLKST